MARTATQRRPEDSDEPQEEVVRKDYVILQTPAWAFPPDMPLAVRELLKKSALQQFVAYLKPPEAGTPHHYPNPIRLMLQTNDPEKTEMVVEWCNRYRQHAALGEVRDYSLADRNREGRPDIEPKATNPERLFNIITLSDEMTAELEKIGVPKVIQQQGSIATDEPFEAHIAGLMQYGKAVIKALEQSAAREPGRSS